MPPVGLEPTTFLAADTDALPTELWRRNTGNKHALTFYAEVSKRYATIFAEGTGIEPATLLYASVFKTLPSSIQTPSIYFVLTLQRVADSNRKV